MIITNERPVPTEIFNSIKSHLKPEFLKNILDMMRDACYEDRDKKIFKKSFNEKIYFDTKNNTFTTLPQKNITVGGVQIEFLSYFPGNNNLSKTMYELSETLKTDEDTFNIEVMKIILKLLKSKFKQFEKTYYQNKLDNNLYSSNVERGIYLYDMI